MQALPEAARVAAEVAPGDLDTLPERIAAAFVAETEAAGGGQTPFVVALILQRRYGRGCRDAALRGAPSAR